LSVPPEDRVATTCTVNCGGLGHAVQGVGDTDGDGVTDQLVDASSGAGGVGRMDQGGLYVFLSKVSASSGVPVVGGPEPGGPGGGPAKDADPPLIALSGKLAQKIGRGYVYVNVQTDEDSTLAASGSVSRPTLRSTPRSAAAAGSKARTYRLLSTKAVAKTRRKVTLRLRLTKAAIKGGQAGAGQPPALDSAGDDHRHRRRRQQAFGREADRHQEMRAAGAAGE